MESPPDKSDTLRKPSLYYDDLDEHGNDKNLPPSFTRDFKYEPNIISEELVRLQRFIHDHHETIEHYIDRVVDGIFYTERKTTLVFRWLREDSPSLVLPTAQLGIASSIGYYANKPLPLAPRLFYSSAMGIMTGFLVFPSWRRKTAELTRRHFIEPVPAIGDAVSACSSQYNKLLMGIVDLWNAYDRVVYNAKNRICTTRDQFVSLFKPRPRS